MNNRMTPREAALRRLQMADFALIDTGLYLDTHPCCQNGLDHFRRMNDLREEALRNYEMQFGPITMMEAGDDCRWEWIDRPWPWELEA